MNPNNPYNNRQVGNDKLQMTNVLHGSTPPQIPLMPPPMPRPRRARGQWKRRAMYAIGRAKGIFFPKWLTQYSISVYVIALAAVMLIYSSHSLPWYYTLSGIVAIVVFFLYGSALTKSLSPLKIRRDRIFERRLFFIAFILRIGWMFFIYSLFMRNYGDAFGFENGDALFYDDLGRDFANALRDGHFKTYWNEISKLIDVSDLGYASYVGLIYWLTDNSIIAVRLMKCILSAWTVMLVYRLAKRNFSSQTARLTAIFVALWPNFWYYCGCHLKETEMVFLAVLFVEQADQMMRSRQFTAWKVIPVLLLAAAMFTFRTPLGLVALLALIFAVVMSSSKVVSWGKRIIVGALALVLIGVVAGNRIEEQSRSLFEQIHEGQQHDNMEWRSVREHGNTFAKYAGSAVFAPMIFTLPFPTMVRPWEGQEVQQLLNGGNYVKNIMSGFTILALFVLLLSGKWRDHMLPLAFTIGYLIVLAFSTFAQSERFHQPVMPFEFMFAAYGLSIAVTNKKYKRWFMYWCGLMLIAAIAWNWFKLAGRGLV